MTIAESVERIFPDIRIVRDHEKSKDYDLYHRSLDYYVDNVRELVSLAEIQKGESVIDAGCGTGISTEVILENNPGRVVGVDNSKSFIEYARRNIRNGNASFVEGTLEGLAEVKFKGETFSEIDKVISSNTFYLTDWEKSLKQIYSILKKDGLFVFNMKKHSAKQNIQYQVYKAFEGAIFLLSPNVAIRKPPIETEKYEENHLIELAEGTGFEIKDRVSLSKKISEEDALGQAQKFVDIYAGKFSEEYGLDTARALRSNAMQYLKNWFHGDFSIGNDVNYSFVKK